MNKNSNSLQHVPAPLLPSDLPTFNSNNLSNDDDITAVLSSTHAALLYRAQQLMDDNDIDEVTIFLELSRYFPNDMKTDSFLIRNSEHLHPSNRLRVADALQRYSAAIDEKEAEFNYDFTEVAANLFAASRQIKASIGV